MLAWDCTASALRPNIVAEARNLDQGVSLLISSVVNPKRIQCSEVTPPPSSLLPSTNAQCVRLGAELGGTLEHRGVSGGELVSVQQ